MKKIMLTLCLILFMSSAYAGSCPMLAKNIDDKIKKAQDYIVTHTFKSKEAKAKMIEVTGSMSMEDMTKAMTSDNAKCQMSWNTPGDNLTMYCWWKGTDPDAINKQLESMNDFYEPHKFVECTDDVIDFNAK